MTTHLSPVWQRKAASSDRLARISARFLSDIPETPGSEGTCQTIPFLLDNAGQSWVTHDLCQVLSQRGHKSMLCHLDEPWTGEPRDLSSEPGARTKGNRYCLVPVTSVETVRAARFDHIVLLVPASLEGVRAAYRRIKLLNEEQPVETGIVIVGPRDQHAAWRYFRKLAVASLRYLDVPLLNLGFLPEQVMPQHGPVNHHRKNFLARISERLVRIGFYLTASDRSATG
ncbi:hypothetical protein DFR30_2497 [Thiogranum longum]|uniref:Uncharacterized protein n=1 Tax=Thiogranum longum TaxID=1537524 RepID=A0A4R1HG26_9GAMM|nr:hypothetical protein [Thiogranum longum]TCK19200.1 hypothetical protein DFR30_2497 [Thiogranum longum]